MLAVRINRFGSPSELQIQTLPKPAMSDDDVLVQIDAAGINPSDVKNVAGVMQVTTLPRTPGRDFAGVVVAGASSLIGQEVWGTGGDLGFTQDGTHAEYIALSKSAVSIKPKMLTMEEAGSIGVIYVTAHLCLEAGGLNSSNTVLVIGATGGVGSAAVQIAKWKGARVLGTVRKRSNLDFLRNLGLDVAINLADGELTDLVKAATNGTGVDLIVDTVGGAILEPCINSLARSGQVIEISSPANERRVSFDLVNFYRQEARLIGVNSQTYNASTCAEILTRLTPGFESGALRPLADGFHSFGLENAISAYEQVQNRSITGRVLFASRS